MPGLLPIVLYIITESRYCDKRGKYKEKTKGHRIHFFFMGLVLVVTLCKVMRTESRIMGLTVACVQLCSYHFFIVIFDQSPNLCMLLAGNSQRMRQAPSHQSLIRIQMSGCWPRWLKDSVSRIISTDTWAIFIRAHTPLVNLLRSWYRRSTVLRSG